MAEQPYFARVNNRTVVAPGEVAYLPCRVKSSQEGYMVSVQIYLHIYRRATWSVSRYIYIIHIYRRATWSVSRYIYISISRATYMCIDTTAVRLQIRLDRQQILYT